MTVLPYVTVSIVESLGSLSLRRSPASRLSRRRRARHAVDGRAGLRPPRVASPFRTCRRRRSSARRCSSSATTFDLVDLYIPSNPFYSLANNVVPAVVLFSIVLGVAVIGTDRKPVLLDVLRVARVALSRATRFIVQLTPYGLFAIAARRCRNAQPRADSAGCRCSSSPTSAYRCSSPCGCCPAGGGGDADSGRATSSRLTRDALITAFVAGDLFIVLAGAHRVEPDAGRTRRRRGSQAVSLPDVIVPASFNFPHTGKLLSISFILFAGWFSDSPVPVLAVSAPGADRPRDVLRQPQLRGAVPARPVPRPGRHVSALRRQQRHQRPFRHPGRGDAYARGGAAQHLRDDRADALRPRRASCATS